MRVSHTLNLAMSSRAARRPLPFLLPTVNEDTVATMDTPSTPLAQRLHELHKQGVLTDARTLHSACVWSSNAKVRSFFDDFLDQGVRTRRASREGLLHTLMRRTSRRRRFGEDELPVLDLPEFSYETWMDDDVPMMDFDSNDWCDDELEAIVEEPAEENALTEQLLLEKFADMCKPRKSRRLSGESSVSTSSSVSWDDIDDVDGFLEPSFEEQTQSIRIGA